MQKDSLPAYVIFGYFCDSQQFSNNSNMKEKTKNIFLSAAVFLSAFLIFSCGKNDGPVPPPAAPEKYAINLIVGDGGESVSATVNDSTVVEAGAGERVRITALAAENHEFSKWIFEPEDVEVGDTSAFQTSFIMPAGEVTVTAEFVEIDTTQVVMLPLYFSELVMHGTIFATVGDKTYSSEEMSSVSVPGGSIVKVEVEPDSGYSFGYWHLEDPTGPVPAEYYWDEMFTDDSRYSNPATFQMPYNEQGATINVILHEAGYKVMADVNDRSMGKVRIITYDTNGDEHNNTLDGVTEWPVYEGRMVRIIAEPEKGYRLKEWTEAEGFVIPEEKIPNTLEFAMPANDVSVTAVFEEGEDLYTVSISQTEGGTIEASVDGQSLADGDGIEAGTVVSVKAVADDRYELESWSGADFADATAYETTFIMPKENVVLSASFINASYILNFSATTGGSVKAEVDGAAITSGTKVEGGRTVTLTAVADNADYSFSRWEGSGVTFADSESAVTSFTMPYAEVAVSAVFEAGGSVAGEYVEIAGIKWAVSNVAAPGTFAENPTDPGMFYQWGFATGFTQDLTPVPSTGSWHSDNADWGPAADIPNTWGDNDPCPEGWRLPVETASSEDGAKEFSALLEATNAVIVDGAVVLTDKTDISKQLILPLPGEISASSGTWQQAGANGRGVYWSDCKRSGNYYTGRALKVDVETFGLNYWSPAYNISTIDMRNAYPVRCVKEE